MKGMDITVSCPEEYFIEHGITPEIIKKSGNTYKAWDGYKGAPPSTLDGLILWRMLQSPVNFEIKSLKLSNLKKHVKARKTIIANALKANFVFLAGDGGISLDPKRMLTDAQSYFDELNNGATPIACKPLTQLIFMTGNQDARAGIRSYDGIWIPGDWGFIKNLNWTAGLWAPGLEGENVIHTGAAAGAELFWGHFHSGTHPAQPESAWFDEIESWTSNLGQVHGAPSWHKSVWYPTIGLK